MQKKICSKKIFLQHLCFFIKKYIKNLLKKKITLYIILEKKIINSFINQFLSLNSFNQFFYKYMLFRN